MYPPNRSIAAINSSRNTASYRSGVPRSSGFPNMATSETPSGTAEAIPSSTPVTHRYRVTNIDASRSAWISSGRMVAECRYRATSLSSKLWAVVRDKTILSSFAACVRLGGVARPWWSVARLIALALKRGIFGG
jgi:hypothetical protein